MPDLDFLPQWYPELRRRRQLVILQAWVTVAVVLVLGVWFALTERNVRAAESTLGSTESALVSSRAELTKLDELLELEKQLLKQEQVLATVGAHVGAARLMTALDELMPQEMALESLKIETLEKRVEPTGLAAATKVAADKTAAVDRNLNVRLVGVCPSQVELANFLARLTGKPYYSGVRLNYTRAKQQQGHIMCEFEVEFAMSLNTAGL